MLLLLSTRAIATPGSFLLTFVLVKLSIFCTKLCQQNRQSHLCCYAPGTRTRRIYHLLTCSMCWILFQLDPVSKNTCAMKRQTPFSHCLLLYFFFFTSITCSKSALLNVSEKVWLGALFHGGTLWSRFIIHRLKFPSTGILVKNINRVRTSSYFE